MKTIFITGTDTGAGKTIVTYALGVLLQDKGFDVGVMKPVQCGGHDALWLKRHLGIKDHIESINPYFAKEPLSPHLAFQRERRRINPETIFRDYLRLKKNHDILLVEGAGGLMVPLRNNYFVADLIKDLRAEVIIVSRLGLGTINHTLLTIEQARARQLKVLGVIFSEVKNQKRGIPEKTNPEAIRKFGRVSILGTLPHLKKLDRKSILKHAQIHVQKILEKLG